MSCSRDPNLDPEEDIVIVNSDDEDLEFVEELEEGEDIDSGAEDEPASQDNDEGRHKSLLCLLIKLQSFLAPE